MDGEQLYLDPTSQSTHRISAQNISNNHTASAAPDMSANLTPSSVRRHRARPRRKSNKPKTVNVSLQANANEFYPSTNDQSHENQKINNSTNDIDQIQARFQKKNVKKESNKSVQSNAVETVSIINDSRKKTAKSKKTYSNKNPMKKHEVCHLCAENILFHAIGECNHHGICSKCSLRMRLLMKDHSCPICKKSLDKVIVYEAQQKTERDEDSRTFDSFDLWGDSGGGNSILDEQADMLFIQCRKHYEALRELREFKCRVRKCNEVKQSLQQLKSHLKNDHHVEFCELCLDHQHFFIQEQLFYTKAALKAHNIGSRKGTNSQQKDFHPLCKFCHQRFYSDAELYTHLERDHFKCHLCPAEHEYFRNYSSLQTHFRQQHHLCEEPRCLENRYVVFPNDIEYLAHMRSVHGVQNQRLVFNFQVARAGENPIRGNMSDSANVDIPVDSWNLNAISERPLISNPANQSRTDAMALEAAFPALPTSSTPPPPPIIAPVIAPSRRNINNTSTIVRDEISRGQLVRNQRLANALGISRASNSIGLDQFEAEMITPVYPQHLVDWAKLNMGYLLVVERRLERIVTERDCHSVSLKVMPAEERALMHELAVFYGVQSKSFGEDTFRRVSFFKATGMKVPNVTLSSFTRNNNQDRKSAGMQSQTQQQLRFLKMDGTVADAQAKPMEQHVPRSSASRGWEKIEPKQRPIVHDAWSDEEEEVQEEVEQ